MTFSKKKQESKPTNIMIQNESDQTQLTDTHTEGNLVTKICIYYIKVDFVVWA